MSSAPRAIGVPLDTTSAGARARQAGVLADPIRVRVLSAFAVFPDGATHTMAAETVGMTPTEVSAAARDLEVAGLLTGDEPRRLTAEAWMRFGRFLTAQPLAGPGTRAGVVPTTSVVERISRDLAYRFASVFSPETVERYVVESHALLTERAKITRHLSSLTARFAADRLSALAAARGLVLRGTPEVLFVCVQNAGRSQMAAAVLRHLAGGAVHVRTAGSAPASAVHPLIVDILDEIGIPIAAEFPKPLTEEVVQAANFVITMGCGDACPIYPGRRYMDWDLRDPLGLPIEEMREIRDEIVARVLSLLGELGLAPLQRG